MSKKVYHDIATFENPPMDKIIDTLANARPIVFGCLVSRSDVKRELIALNKALNHGRVKKVSIKRPSPKLSRGEWFGYQAGARINALARKYDEPN